METHTHSLACLFEQLGLGSTDREIHNFIKNNAPLSGAVELHKANFWSLSQSSFLKQAKDEDADWAEVVDQLNIMIHLPQAKQ
ncbi:MAG: DUF2789 domain-containing protein [Gammaproteobacteria bacterium]|nr:DUF2789 domain-containing protein [Gammaproteobacteria bacterium]